MKIFPQEYLWEEPFRSRDGFVFSDDSFSEFDKLRQ
jgi:hypothetical protein